MAKTETFGGMVIKLSPGTKHGECDLCGKIFYRRSLGFDDDGTLCKKCYEQLEKRVDSNG